MVYGAFHVFLIFVVQIILIRNVRAHIAYLLLLLFSITWLPLHVFHAHEVEVHKHALLSHDEEHTCTFDTHFCEYHDAGDCGHTAHLETTHAGCFTCSFHFTKHVELATQSELELDVLWQQQYADALVLKVCETAVHHQVRGPPVAVYLFV